MKSKALDATTTRWILVGIIVLLVCGGIAGAWQLQMMLNEKLAATNQAKVDAINNNDNLAKAQALKIYLENHQAEIDKTARIVADTEAYKYQDQIVQDITKYAEVSGLRVLGFDFPTTTKTNTSSTGLKSIAATITLRNPVPYRNYLTFLKLIEQNLTKMQITDVSIVPDKDDPNLINNPVIGLEVYIK